MFWNHLLTHSLRFWTLVPWIWLASIYTLGSWTANVLGHLSRFCLRNHPDELFSNAVFWMGVGLTYLQMISPVIFSFLLGLNQIRTRCNDWRVHAGVFTLGWLTFIFLAVVDPGGIMEWWFH